jgi:tetratricopeptide (TPR) repeat protein
MSRNESQQADRSSSAIVDAWDAALLGAGFNPVDEQVVAATPERGGPIFDAASPGTIQIARVTLADSGAVLLLPTSAGITAADDGAPGGADRGAISLLARVLTNSSIGKKAIKLFATTAVNGTVGLWERSHRPAQARLFRTVDAGTSGAPMSAANWQQISSGRSLLFLHGTLGQAHTSFAGFDRDLLDALMSRYEGRVWAFDHHTLSDSPQTNAADLLELIGAYSGAALDVDIVGYDRGGLVARELSRGGDPRIRVGNLTLVGAPMLGTPLAQPEHMIAYANRLANLATLAPDPIADAAGAIVTVLVHLFSGAIDSLPGLAAMQPPKEAGGVASARLHVVGADYTPDGATALGRVFTNWAVDNVMQGVPNDLLVPTSSALIDTATAAESPTSRHLVHGISHGGYWSHAAVNAALRGALLDAPIAASADSAPRPQVPRLRDFGTPAVGSPAAGGSPAAAGNEPRREPLVVSVMHGSLEHVEQPLLVGHVQGTPMTGAEQRLDECFDGRLSRRRMLRRYPGLLREVAIVPNVAGATPPSAVIVGLGVTGSLTASRLVDTLIAGLLDLAMAEVDIAVGDIAQRSGTRAAKTPQQRPISLATVLVGSSTAAGLTVESCVRAMVSAVIAAEARLAETPVVMADGTQRRASEVVRFQQLRLVERYADRVDIVAGVLARLRAEHGAQPPGEIPLDCRPRPEVAEGSSPGSAPVDSDETWRRLEVRVTTADGDSALEYTSMGRLARAEKITKHFNPNVVDPLLEGSIGKADDAQIAGSLFELLLPTELKGELGSGENLHLLVDESSAYIPWELLAPRAKGYQAQLPIALRSGALRQFTETARLRSRPRMASGNSALVIGNPPPPPGFAPLPGAAAEAMRAATILEQQGYATTRMIWDAQGRPLTTTSGDVELDTPDGGTGVVHQLLNGDWRIVHIAAHGQLTDSPNTSGVLLSDGVYLTTDVFESLSIVPDLVFLNACHSGGIGRSLVGMNRVAASVARTLMQIGVRAVVVAGWAVNDAAASMFAEDLYQSMLAGGADFGTAVTAARRLVHDEMPSTMTWGAYQCYGDPGFRLSNKRSRSSDGPAYTENELRRRARHIISAAGDQGRNAGFDDEVEVDSLRSRLADRLAALNPSSPAADALTVDQLSSVALADLAEAYGELGDFVTAIDLYTRAVQHERADAPIRALEQLGNLQVREAQRLAAASDSANPSREVTALLNDSLRWLNRALDISDTGERLAMLGSYYNKRAAMTPSRSGAYLRKSIEYYRLAQLKRPKNYHLFVWTQLACIAALRGEALPPEFESSPAEVRSRFEEGVEAAASTEGFWGRTAVGDRALTRALVEGTDDLRAATTAYRKAFALRSSRRERAVVSDHLADLANIAPAGSTRDRLFAAHDNLEAWTPRP